MVFVLDFRLTQQERVLALLVRQVLLEQVLAVPLHLPLVSAFVCTSFLLRVLRQKKVCEFSSCLRVCLIRSFHPDMYSCRIHCVTWSGLCFRLSGSKRATECGDGKSSSSSKHPTW